MKLAVRVLLLALIVAILVTGYMLDWEVRNLSLPQTPTTSSTAPDFSNDPVLYVVLKLVFSF